MQGVELCLAYTILFDLDEVLQLSPKAGRLTTAEASEAEDGGAASLLGLTTLMVTRRFSPFPS
jgi:hypothetical protein